MKKLLSFLVMGCFTFGFYAQTGLASDKKILAGITLGGALNINLPGTKTIKSKVGGDFMVGMMLDWNFSKNVGLTTGLEFEFDNFKTLYNNAYYFRYNDKEILREKDGASSDDAYFMFESRKHKSIYLTIPVMLKFQTNYIGYLRYFGRFGVRNSALLMTRVDNEGFDADALGVVSLGSTLSGMRNKSLMSFYRGSVGLSGGAEYNITGSTTLVAEIGYFYGFSEMFNQSDKTRSLYEYKEDANDPGKFVKSTYAPKLKQGLVMLKASVLF